MPYFSNYTYHATTSTLSAVNYTHQQGFYQNRVALEKYLVLRPIYRINVMKCFLMFVHLQAYIQITKSCLMSKMLSHVSAEGRVCTQVSSHTKSLFANRVRQDIPQWSLNPKRLIFVALCNDLIDYFIVCFEHQCNTMRAF